MVGCVRIQSLFVFLLVNMTPAISTAVTLGQCVSVVKKVALYSPFQSSKPKEPLTLKRAAKNIGIAAATIAFGLGPAPTIGQRVYAYAHGADYVGLGIYLNMTEIEGLLTEEERAIVRSPNANPNDIIFIYADYLSGDYKKTSLEFWPLPKNAKDYFRGQCKERGMCKHKAYILTAILNHYGIKARLESGDVGTITDGSDRQHQWVVREDTNEVIDPTWGSLRPRGYTVPRDEYLKTNKIELSNAFLDSFGPLYDGAFR